MKHLQDFKLFEDRKESLSLIGDLKEGQSLIANKDIDFSEIDYKEIASTWWGKNISNINNILKNQEGVWTENYKFKKGDVIFISQGGTTGYEATMGRDIMDGEHNPTLNDFRYYINKIPVELSDDDSAFFGLLLQEGICGIVNYEEIDEKFRKEFELDVKLSKININLDNNNKISVISDHLEDGENILFNKISIKRGMVRLDVIKDNSKKDSYFFSKESILNEFKFSTESGEINSNPFG